LPSIRSANARAFSATVAASLYEPWPLRAVAGESKVTFTRASLIANLSSAGRVGARSETRPGSKRTTSLKIRRADPGDTEAVRRISADAYVLAYMAVLGTIPRPATEDYGPRIERGEVWILEIEGETIGIAVLEVNTDHLFIYSIAVKPYAQRKGYGRVLLDFADNLAIELRLYEIRLYTNERMERNLTLYERHGFVQVGKRPHPSRSGQVLVDMVRKLPRPTGL
jgi:ribosomal protein S18 acetylase RimI-like enzyme